VIPRSPVRSTSGWRRRLTGTASLGCSRPISPATTMGPRSRCTSHWSWSMPCPGQRCLVPTGVRGHIHRARWP